MSIRAQIGPRCPRWSRNWPSRPTETRNSRARQLEQPGVRFLIRWVLHQGALCGPEVELCRIWRNRSYKNRSLNDSEAVSFRHHETSLQPGVVPPECGPTGVSRCSQHTESGGCRQFWFDVPGLRPGRLAASSERRSQAGPKILLPRLSVAYSLFPSRRPTGRQPSEC